MPRSTAATRVGGKHCSLPYNVYRYWHWTRHHPTQEKGIRAANSRIAKENYYLAECNKYTTTGDESMFANLPLRERPGSEDDCMLELRSSQSEFLRHQGPQARQIPSIVGEECFNLCRLVSPLLTRSTRSRSCQATTDHCPIRMRGHGSIF